MQANEGGSKAEYKELQACAALLAAHYNLVRLYQAHVRLFAIFGKGTKDTNDALRSLDKVATKNRGVYETVQGRIEDHSKRTPRNR